MTFAKKMEQWRERENAAPWKLFTQLGNRKTCILIQVAISMIINIIVNIMLHLEWHTNWKWTLLVCVNVNLYASWSGNTVSHRRTVSDWRVLSWILRSQGFNAELTSGTGSRAAGFSQQSKIIHILVDFVVVFPQESIFSFPVNKCWMRVC